MPEDTSGPVQPDEFDHGRSNGEFDALVFDDAFVRGAVVHEPTADERIAAAVESRMREEPPGTRLLNGPGFAGPAIEPAEHPAELYDADGRPYRDCADPHHEDDDPRHRHGGLGGYRGYGGYGHDPYDHFGGYRDRHGYREYGGYGGYADEAAYSGFDPMPGYHDGYAGYAPSRRDRGSAVRGHRLVAWVLAVVMGIGVLAMAVSAVYRGASGSSSGAPETDRGGTSRQQPDRPADPDPSPTPG